MTLHWFWMVTYGDFGPLKCVTYKKQPILLVFLVAHVYNVILDCPPPPLPGIETHHTFLILQYAWQFDHSCSFAIPGFWRTSLVNSCNISTCVALQSYSSVWNWKLYEMQYKHFVCDLVLGRWDRVQKS